MIGYLFEYLCDVKQFCLCNLCSFLLLVFAREVAFNLCSNYHYQSSFLPLVISGKSVNSSICHTFEVMKKKKKIINSSIGCNMYVLLLFTLEFFFDRVSIRNCVSQNNSSSWLLCFCFICMNTQKFYSHQQQIPSYGNIGHNIIITLLSVCCFVSSSLSSSLSSSCVYTTVHRNGLRCVGKQKLVL